MKHWVFYAWLLIAGIPLLVQAGDIDGFVKFPGETPPPMIIANAVEAACPHAIAQNHLIVHQENRGLKNALVILDFKDDAVTTKATPAGLKVEKCTFSPRVQWTTLPAYLTMTNLDATDQDVRLTIDGVRVFEVDLSGKNNSIRRPLSRAKLYKVDSHLHPWMRAWVYASAHPYVGITDAYGHFAIAHVPAGKYSIRAWHEGWTPKGKDKEGHIDYQPVEDVREVRVPEEGRVEIIFEGLAPTF